MSQSKQSMSATSIFTILLGVVIIAALSQASMNFPLFPTDVPGTLQTFAVLIFAYSTNRWMGFMAVLIYLMAGIYGYPVFAEGASGKEVLFGKTGGYLTGFLVAAYVVGILGEKEEWRTSFTKGLIAMTIGTLIILAFGVAFLSNFLGIADAFQYGFIPFLLGGAIKIVLGAGIWPFHEWLQRYHAK